MKTTILNTKRIVIMLMVLCFLGTKFSLAQTAVYQYAPIAAEGAVDTIYNTGTATSSIINFTEINKTTAYRTVYGTGAEVVKTSYKGSTAYALHFDPALEHGFEGKAFTNADIMHNANVSFDLWIKPNATDPGANQLVFEAGGNAACFEIILDNSGVNPVIIARLSRIAGIDDDIVVESAITSDDFSHVVFTLDIIAATPEDKLLSMYVNGVFKQSAEMTAITQWAGGDQPGLGMVGGPTTASSTSAQDPLTATRGGTITRLSADLGCLRLFPGVITQEEITSLFSAGLPVTTEMHGSVYPANGENLLGTNASLKLTFKNNNDIVAVTGKNIVIYNSDATAFSTIAADDITQVSISGNVVDIKPDNDFLSNENYYVLIEQGAFTDASGNVYVGILGSEEWTFYVPNSNADHLVYAYYPPLTDGAISTWTATAVEDAVTRDFQAGLHDEVLVKTGATVTEEVVDGKNCKVVEFDATQNNGFETSPFSDVAVLMHDKNISIDFWVKPDAANTDTQQMIFETGGAGFGFAITLNNTAGSESVSAVLSKAMGLETNSVATTNITPGIFNHIAITIDIQNTESKTLSIYCNNVLGMSTVLDNNTRWSGGEPAGLGVMGGFQSAIDQNASNIVTKHFSGQLGCFRLFDEVLTSEEVSALYDLGLPVVTSLVDYNITYNLNGGINSTNNPVTFTVDEIPFNLEAATKTGENFEGWYDGADFATANLVTQIATTGDIELWAKFNIDPVYNVTFNYGTNTIVRTATIENDYLVNLPNAPAKEGYTFLGWFEEDGSGNEFTESTVVTEDTTVYAKWDIIEYNISYNLDGGTNGATNPATFVITDLNITLADAAKDGYSFNGWFNEAGFINQMTEITDIGDVELWAMFTENVGVEINEAGNFDFYPNPAKKVLFFEADQQVDRIEIYNITGTLEIQVAVNGRSAELNISELNSGLYVTRVYTSKGSQLFKFIKQ